MYPNMMHPIPFMKHKSKHPAGLGPEKHVISPEKNEDKEQKKEENIPENQNQNQMQEEPKQDETK